MHHLETIRGSLKQALSQGCGDMLCFTGEPSAKINAEYLLTVNVAKAIAARNSHYADPYRVVLEDRTRQFARESLRPFVQGNPMTKGSTKFRPQNPQIKRNGRIDVAVYTDDPNSGWFGPRPLCAIELKAFNPSRKSVLADLKRNLEYLRLKGPTGQSCVNFTLFGALHALGKPATEENVRSNELDLRIKYQTHSAELGDIGNFQVEVESFTISKEFIGEIYDYGDHASVDASSRHHFVGIVVTIQKRQIGASDAEQHAAPDPHVSAASPLRHGGG